LYGDTVLKVFAKEQEATKNDEVRVHCTSCGSSSMTSASDPEILKRLSKKSFRVLPTLLIY
jgi:hypothetical protein